MLSESLSLYRKNMGLLDHWDWEAGSMLSWTALGFVPFHERACRASHDMVDRVGFERPAESKRTQSLTARVWGNL